MKFTTECAGYPKKSCPFLLDAGLRGGGPSTDVDLRLGGVGTQHPFHQWNEEDVGVFLGGLRDVFGKKETDFYVNIFR